MDKEHENDQNELDPIEQEEPTSKREDLKAKARRVLSRNKAEEPKDDDLDDELDVPRPKKKSRLNLTDLSSVDEKDA